MPDSTIRTISVPFSPAEHRLLGRFAAAQGVDTATLIREALALAPFEASACPTQLGVVRVAGEACAPSRRAQDRVLTGR